MSVLHWVNTDLWGPMWPNVFSPNVWTVVAVLCHLVATLAQQRRNHEDMKQHVTNSTGGSAGADH